LLPGSRWDSFIDMQEHCHRCGGELSEGDETTSFCPHCGAPQLYLQEYDRPNGATEPDSTGAPPPPHPQVVDWKTAIRCAALVAGIAAVLTVLAMGLPGIPLLGTIGTFWTLTAAMTAVTFYQRSRPLAKMDARVGARIGLTTGVALVACIAFAMAAAGVVARFMLHSTGGFDAQVTELLQQVTVQLSRSAAGSPELPGVLKFVASPEFRAGYALATVATGAVILLLFSTLGGAVGGLFRTRRQVAP
jgi:predicted RNA-binding Zn-ribbon protein involved in translation (DUF1610 family)